VLQDSTKEKGERAGVNGTRCRGKTCLLGKFGGCGKVFQIAFAEVFITETPIL
jgi:hypothetical protein